MKKIFRDITFFISIFKIRVEVRRHTEIVPNSICEKISSKNIFFQNQTKETLTLFKLQLSIKYNIFEKKSYKHKFSFVLQNFPILSVEWNIEKKNYQILWNR